MGTRLLAWGWMGLGIAVPVWLLASEIGPWELAATAFAVLFGGGLGLAIVVGNRSEKEIMEHTPSRLVGAVFLLLLVFAGLWLAAALVGSTGSLPVLSNGNLTWDTRPVETWQANRTARFVAEQQQETARKQAEEETSRKAIEEWNATFRTWAMWGAVIAVLVVIAVQTGRTLRHRETQRTARVALLQNYIALSYPAGANVQITSWQGAPAIIDHDGGEIVPYQVAQQEMRQIEAKSYALARA